MTARVRRPGQHLARKLRSMRSEPHLPECGPRLERGRSSGYRRTLRMHPSGTVDLTVVLPVLNERDNLAALLPRLDGVLRQLDCTYEVLVVDGGSADGTADLAGRLGSRVIVQRS